MTWRLTAQGKTGITNNSTYDAWTPSRAYQHYHGGVRILTETASAGIASPITVPFDSLRPGRGYDSKVSSWNFLVPWQGGTWTIGNIVDYQVSASWALLSAAAPMRTTWLENFSRVGERAVLGNRAPERAKWPAAFVIPMQQPDQASLRAMLRILQRGQVEIRRATSPFVANRVRFSAGTYVVMLDQPYGGFAKALLENQHYPDLHEYPGGPPKAPYDVTAQTLPLLMGVGAVAVDSFPVTMTDVIGADPAAQARRAGTQRKVDAPHRHLPQLESVDGRGVDALRLRSIQNPIHHDRRSRGARGESRVALRRDHPARTSRRAGCRAGRGRLPTPTPSRGDSVSRAIRRCTRS